MPDGNVTEINSSFDAFGNSGNTANSSSSRAKSQFEIALEQKEFIIRQEYEINSLRKQISKIESDTISRVNKEWEGKVLTIEREMTIKKTRRSFWIGLALGVIIILIFNFIGSKITF
jgi:hypothetical protein